VKSTSIELKDRWQRQLMRKLCKESTTEKGVVIAGPYIDITSWQKDNELQNSETSAIADSLVSKKLVKRKDDASNFIQLTDDGREYCKKTILIRLRSKAKKLVTEAQAQEIDCERAIKSETYGLDELALTQFEKLKKTSGYISQKDLLKALRDIKWQMYNRDLEYCAKANWKSCRIFQPRRWNEDVRLRQRGSWGSYRTVRFEMGKQLRKESKFAEALPIYLEVFYLDINGAEPDFKGVWRPDLGYAASDIVKEIQRIVKKLALSRAGTNEVFFYNERVQTRLKLPISVSQAWSKLENELVFK
jgi:DNA-binding MarR family transcriptional regulator